MSETTDQFAVWVGHDSPVDAQKVQCLCIKFEATGDVYRITDYGQPFSARDENGSMQDYQAIPFRINNEEVGATTEQSIVVVVDGMQGSLYRDIIAPMSQQQKQSTVELTLYTYLDLYPDGPAIVPPPQYYVTEVRANQLTLELVATNTLLPNRRAGTQYTISAFPTLRYV